MANKPKPTNLKILQGNPGKRPLPENEPRLEVERPRAPTHLSPQAKAHWPKIVKKLADAKVMTRLDADALALYCEHYAQWAQANQELATNGMTDLSAQGVPIMSPWLTISMKAAEAMRKLLIEFGMTPSARTKVQTVPDDSGKADPWANL